MATPSFLANFSRICLNARQELGFAESRYSTPKLWFWRSAATFGPSLISQNSWSPRSAKCAFISVHECENDARSVFTDKWPFSGMNTIQASHHQLIAFKICKTYSYLCSWMWKRWAESFSRTSTRTMRWVFTNKRPFSGMDTIQESYDQSMASEICKIYFNLCSLRYWWTE